MTIAELESAALEASGKSTSPPNKSPNKSNNSPSPHISGSPISPRKNPSNVGSPQQTLSGLQAIQNKTPTVASPIISSPKKVAVY